MLSNGQESNWFPIKPGVPQGSIRGPLLFLKDINDLPDGLNSAAKLFAIDTSLLSIMRDLNESAKYLNNWSKCNFLMGIQVENDFQPRS